MKMNLLAASALAVALAAPIGVCAQQSQPPAAGYSQSRTMPDTARMQRHWARRFGRLNLSGDQQQRIQSIINQYSQAHPEGSAPDRGSYRAMRRQLMGVLTGDQQNQFRLQMRARRAQMLQRQGQMQGQRYQGQGYQSQGYQGAPGDQRYGQPGQRYGPPNQGYQQGPPDQGFQQGPPDQQYQQGPPPDQQQESNGPPPA